jgi:hypothetical protein
MDNTLAYAQCGSVVSVRGGIVDIRFGSRVPSIHSLLRAGRQDAVVIEILSRLGTMILAILLSISSFIFPVVMSALGLLTRMVQAYIFSILATVYIAAATARGGLIR